MIILKLPNFMIPRINCIGDILPPYVSVDKEIGEEIKELWNKGIRTTGCCAGHPEGAYIGVTDDCVRKMEELGYKHFYNPHDGDNQKTFHPKSLNTKSLVERMQNRLLVICKLLLWKNRNLT